MTSTVFLELNWSKFSRKTKLQNEKAILESGRILRERVLYLLTVLLLRTDFLSKLEIPTEN